MKKIIALFNLILIGSGYLNSQTIISPNYSKKSHETLNIIKVENRPEAAIFYMSIENKIEKGSFCADRNIFIIYPDGKKSKLVSSSGIPVCPDTYQFRSPGEKLEFILSFPPLAKGVEWVDLIEECNENCFSFYGIALGVDLNERIDNAFRLAENDETAKALASFITLADELSASGHGISGLLYINIIKLSASTGDYKKAAEWYRKLKSSDLPRVDELLKHLNDQGIRY